MYNRKLIAAAIIEKDNKFLIVQREKPADLYGKWEFPGGKVEGEETLKACLKRELKEELSIDAEIGQYLCSNRFTYKDVPYEINAFRVKSYTGDIVLTEHLKYEWVSLKEIEKFDLTKPDILITDYLREISLYNDYN